MGHAGPKSVYARSKLPPSLRSDPAPPLYIVRTACCTPAGNSFVTKILATADQVGALQVVTDEVSSPTYAPDWPRPSPADSDRVLRYLPFYQTAAFVPLRLGCAVLKLACRDHVPVSRSPPTNGSVRRLRLSTRPGELGRARLASRSGHGKKRCRSTLPVQSVAHWPRWSFPTGTGWLTSRRAWRPYEHRPTPT